MTGTELDEILDDEGQQETTEQITETTQTEQAEGPARDEHGRFAAKAEGDQQERDKPEEQQEAQGEPEAGEDGKVPQQALHASRQREREVKAENDTLRQQLAEMQGQISMLSRQVSQPREQPKREEQKAPDFWEDPDAFVKSAVSPIEQNAQKRFEQFSKMMAVEKHGQEKVDAAFQALAQAGQSGDPQAKAAYQSIMSNPHPYGALVQWHEQRETLKRVGNDPNAYFDSEFERRMAEDPEFAKKVMARVTGQAQQNGRSESVTKLPPSLGRLPAGTNQPEDDDVSDAALFSHALR